SCVANQPARFPEDFTSTRQVWNCAKDIPAAFFQRQRLQQAFQTGLILEVEHTFESGDLFFRKFDAVDNSSEEIDAAEIDLELRDSQPLQRLHCNQQNFNVGL